MICEGSFIDEKLQKVEIAESSLETFDLRIVINVFVTHINSTVVSQDVLQRASVAF